MYAFELQQGSLNTAYACMMKQRELLPTAIADMIDADPRVSTFKIPKRYAYAAETYREMVLDFLGA